VFILARFIFPRKANVVFRCFSRFLKIFFVKHDSLSDCGCQQIEARPAAFSDKVFRYEKNHDFSVGIRKKL